MKIAGEWEKEGVLKNYSGIFIKNNVEQKIVINTKDTVSYTHLDVYKRQRLSEKAN